ncbi:MAG: nicotinate (nicotinamide) nucleotide adenylyltransferase [Dehalococcoidia bacterium]|nr:nicotinate (nicotinamide) nucleotide adenylyltransferase [Dehalococcoidia bacterium]
MNGNSRKIGILGGTFDPVHIAHLVMAERAISDLELEKVIFVPTGVPWMKANTNITLGLHRINMLRLALSDNPLFEISTLETNRFGPSYTIDTLELIRKEYGDQTRIYFLMGSDALYRFADWKKPREVLDLSYLVVFTRAVTENIANILLNPVFEKRKDKIIEKNSVNIAISSSAIRDMIRNNRPLEGNVPDKVVEYIIEERLYTDE